ncbi:hypothetical protein LEP1GSC038_1894 [Leptospira weilii str. 2006001855]|uniref:Uncharacterized protein n=1 Tax=Leptospira weilii str. 2006001855 TaxID=996804 RepID=M6FJS8_9LEPT|nr:hypothetical protein LEP1GSC038_1894 [Leptospira weilii str. 2006001855]
MELRIKFYRMKRAFENKFIIKEILGECQIRSEKKRIFRISRSITRTHENGIKN